MNRRAPDRAGQDRRRCLPRHRGDAADVPPLAAAVRGYAGRGGQAADPAGEGERPAQKASGGGGAREGDALAAGFCEAVGSRLRETSEPGTQAQGRFGPEGALPGIRATGLPGGGPAPQHPAPYPQGLLDRGRKLRHRLRENAADHVSRGRRMAYRLLRREGWTVKHKRVQRLWREEGLQRAHTQAAQAGTARQWISAASPGRASPSGVGHGLPVRRHRRWPQAQVPEPKDFLGLIE